MPQRIVVALPDDEPEYETPPQRWFYLHERNVGIIAWYIYALIQLISDLRFINLSDKYEILLPMTLGLCARLAEMQQDVPQDDVDAHCLLKRTIDMLSHFPHENQNNYIRRLRNVFSRFPEKLDDSNPLPENANSDDPYTLTAMLVSQLRFFQGPQRYATAAFSNRGGNLMSCQQRDSVSHTSITPPTPSYAKTPSSTALSTPASLSFASESDELTIKLFTAGCGN